MWGQGGWIFGKSFAFVDCRLLFWVAFSMKEQANLCFALC
jgi:hypothetical protein